MRHVNKYYIVLSVSEISKLFRAAKADQKARRKKATHCVVVSLTSAEGTPSQLSSASFRAAIEDIKMSTAEYLQVDKE